MASFYQSLETIETLVKHISLCPCSFETKRFNSKLSIDNKTKWVYYHIGSIYLSCAISFGCYIQSRLIDRLNRMRYTELRTKCRYNSMYFELLLSVKIMGAEVDYAESSIASNAFSNNEVMKDTKHLTWVLDPTF
jgi:hypothetical protein